MTLEELIAVCDEHGVSDGDIPHVCLAYRDGENPLQAIGRATRRCHLCDVLLGDDFVETARNRLYWCPDLERCKYRARQRLGIPRRGRDGTPGAWDMLQDDLYAAGRRPGVIRST